MRNQGNSLLDSTDRKIIEMSQGGLPVTQRPYHVIAERLNLDPENVMERIRSLQTCGVIRRIGVVPNHYRLGYRANGMTVWDVPDDRVNELGRKVGTLDFVSHCYHRPRHMPDWPYNLFAMVHARDRDLVDRYVEKIAGVLGEANRQHDVLYHELQLQRR